MSTIRYMSTREAGEYLGLSVRTLVRLRSEGGGPRYQHIRLMAGVAIRYRTDDLDKWVGAGGRSAPGSDSQPGTG